MRYIFPNPKKMIAPYQPTLLLHTERLQLFPLTYKQLLKYARNDGSLDADLQLSPTMRTISADLQEALHIGILPNVANKRKNYLFHTLWAIVFQTENQMVGDLCFKGEPNSAGEIEIGYGTYEPFQGRGYMTEAVGAMIGWAATQPKIKYITAGTDKANLASGRVLEKNQFQRLHDNGTTWWWRREIRKLGN
jgi:RimJ/RimL family protein N-acetyltransferase